MKDDGNAIRKVLDYNWKYGYCSHIVAFEGTEIIRRLRLSSGMIAFGMIDGRVCVINLETGEILNKFHEHSTEISAIDFNGNYLATGGADGLVVITDLKNNVINKDNSKISKASNTYNLFKRSVSGIRILTSANKKLLVSASMDKWVKAIDIDTGDIRFQLELSSVPLCLDVFEDYISVGCYDGRIIFISARSGKQILTFQAHNSRVRSIHLMSKSVLFTGGGDGIVKKWDLSGESASKPVGVINRPTGFLDYFFSDAINAKGEASVTTSSSDNTSNQSKGSENVRVFEHSSKSPVVAIQGDDDKVIVAYDDGMISSWDVQSGKSMFDLKGRSNLISSLQFDETRLVADGTHSIVVIHDFNNTENSDSDLQYELSNNEYDDDDNDDNDSVIDQNNDNDNDDDDDDGTPSATS